MAKAKHVDAPAETDGTIAVHVPAGLVLSYGDFQLNVADASPATLAYCLANGYHQSMVDAAAFSKEDKAGKTDDEIAAMAHDARQKRHDNIVAGTVGARVGGPRKRGIDAIIEEVAEKYAIAKMVAANHPLPKKGKGYAEAMSRLVALAMTNDAFAAIVRRDAQAQFDAANAAVAALGDVALTA